MSLLPEVYLQGKEKTWGAMGRTVALKEKQLELAVQQINAKLKTPTTIEEVPEAEVLLASTKKELDALVKDRMETTAKLDAVITRLLAPEKTYQPEAQKIKSAIIKLKEAYEKQKKDKAAKQQEEVRIKAEVLKYVADMHAAQEQKQAKLILDSYEYALKNITPENLEQYLIKLKGRVTEQSATIPRPKNITTTLSQEDLDDIISANFNPLFGLDYVASFTSALDLRYSDYALAYKNKEQALNVAKNEAVQKTTEIEQTQQQQVVGAVLSGMSTITPTEEIVTKELKKSYKIANEETMSNALIIINAYITNINKTRPETTELDKAFNFGVKQMKAALEKVKKQDSNFNFTGLIWKEESKL